jgi:hypothetical protein
MGKASSSKKVARAARVGAGARRARASRSYFWPAFVTIVVVLGTLGVVFSRNQRTTSAAPLQAPSTDNSPPVIGDHWHAAYGVYICGKFATPISDQSTDPIGIHSHADGVIHTHPFRIKGRPFTGKNANLGAFLKVFGGKITPTSLKYPGSSERRNGQKCGAKPAELQVLSWKEGDPVEAGQKVADPAKLRIFDRQLITIAFVPKGDPIPQPPSAPRLDKLNDVPSTTVAGETPPSTDAGATTPTTETPPTTTP